MKLTKQQLKQIIKEELGKVLNEYKDVPEAEENRIKEANYQGPVSCRQLFGKIANMIENPWRDYGLGDDPDDEHMFWREYQESLEQYTDSGASCSDQEDGNISHQVEVSGDIVNMSSTGTYMIFYNCSDSDGNAAQTKHRTVFIIPPIIADENEDGFDDDGFMAGAQSGDVNLDGVFNIVDIVLGVEILLNGE